MEVRYSLMVLLVAEEVGEYLMEPPHDCSVYASGEMEEVEVQGPVKV